MSETKTHCSCGRRIADNFELRATIMSLEKNWENASSACNRVAGERDKYKQQLQQARQEAAKWVADLLFSPEWEKECHCCEDYYCSICRIKDEFKLAG